MIEANLDDLNPQVFGYVMDRLFAEGALDVFGTPVQMKKGRPGMVLTVLARPEQASQMTKIIFAETTTLGVRMREERRAGAAAALHVGANAVGRGAHEDRQPEWDGDELRA